MKIEWSIQLVNRNGHQRTSTNGRIINLTRRQSGYICTFIAVCAFGPIYVFLHKIDAHLNTISPVNKRRYDHDMRLPKKCLFRPKLYYSGNTDGGSVLYFFFFFRKEETKRFVPMGGILMTLGWCVPGFIADRRSYGEGGPKLKNRMTLSSVYKNCCKTWQKNETKILVTKIEFLVRRYNSINIYITNSSIEEVREIWDTEYQVLILKLNFKTLFLGLVFSA